MIVSSIHPSLMVTSLSILGSAMIAFVAQWGLAGPAALVLYAMVRRWRWRTDGAEAAISGLGTLALVMLSAMAFVHPRPFVQLRTVPLVPHVADNSFPSDHLAACGLAVGFLFNRSRSLSWATLAFSVLLGAARVLAWLHWPIDIVGGFADGIIASSLGRFVILRFLVRTGNSV